MKKTLVVSLVAMLLLVAGSVMADSYLKQATFMDGMEMMGQSQPARYDTSETWIAKGMIYSKSSDGGVFIGRVDQGKAYLVDHVAKTYSEMPIDLTEIFETATEKMDKKTTDEVAGMMGSIKTIVTPTDEVKKIKDWNAKKYVVEMDMTMMKTLMDTYTTEDIKIDVELLNLSNQCMMAPLPGFEDMINEMKKIKGVPVFNEGHIEVMGTKIKTTMELLEYKEADAPAGIFDIPEGYKKIEMKMGMGGK
ncbi:MAG: hypothetical protein KOO62_04430 [candidate division Zixibacteria bacterium]|nr:hypothetical protein [candidate division Zixibacteria bacterium]